MTFYAATRLTLNKVDGDKKPILAKHEPFPDLPAYTKDDMARLEAEGLVYRKPEKRAKEPLAKEPPADKSEPEKPAE